MEPNADKDPSDADPLTFATLIAHQIQSPLTSISELLRAVLAEYTGPLSAPQRGPLERASRRCDEAISSVRRMLAIIQAQSAHETPARPGSLERAMRQAHEQIAEESAARGIEIQMDLPLEAAYARLEEAAFEEIALALLGNALKYTPDHGRIRVRVGPSPREGFVHLSVADSGVGIPEEERSRVFDPLYRTTEARRSTRPGSGLGLMFVKRVVTAAGGSVWVGESDLGGADFHIELPGAPPPEGPEPDDTRPPLRVVIVGGVAAGPKAAAKIIRLVPEADVTVVEQGSVLSYAGCGLPYYVSGLVRSQKTLISSPAGEVRDPVFFSSVKNVHVMNQTEAVEIDRAAQRVRVHDPRRKSDVWLPYDRLLLATGASPVVPASLQSPLLNVFTLHGMRDAEGIKAALAKGPSRDVVIVGGGLLGLEMTVAFAQKGARVTILEKQSRLLPVVDEEIAALIERHLEAHGVRVMTRTPALSFRGDTTVTGVVTPEAVYPADLVILAIGVTPNVTLARQAGLAIGETGAIRVDRRLATSDPNIFAAGDCAESTHLVTGRPVYIPLGSTANKQARVAAVNMCGGENEFPGLLGSCICRIFNYVAARTGLGEEEAREAGFDVVTVLVPGPDREHFMPDMGLVLLKLIVDRRTRRLLGAQATGDGAGDKRIDVAAMAIQGGLTIDQVANADLCYAPPYSPAMDNLITAANVARNKLDGRFRGIKPAEVWRRLRARESFLFLDVRTPEEHEQVRLPSSTLIPLGALRGRCATLPRHQPIVTFCNLSLRGYEAALILSAAGFDSVEVMEGGVAMWPYETLQ